MDNEVLDEAKDSETASESLRELLLQDTKAAKQYLRDSFLTEAMITLFRARRQADLTQAEVASRLGTKQSAIARWEADFSGKISLRNYVDFALACGVRPLDFTLEPVSDVVQFAVAHPGEAITADRYSLWQSTNSASQGVEMPFTFRYFSTSYAQAPAPLGSVSVAYVPYVLPVQQGVWSEFYEAQTFGSQVPRYSQYFGTVRPPVTDARHSGGLLYGSEAGAPGEAFLRANTETAKPYVTGSTPMEASFEALALAR